MADRNSGITPSHWDSQDLRLPPSNRLEALAHDRAGRWSIPINDQWRVCFRFETGDAYNVEIIDCH